MRFELTARFRGDHARLSESEKRLFAKAVRLFASACDRHAKDPSAAWPASLRVRDVEGATGVLGMTWSFSGPDGRTTFEWVRIDGELAVRWRRIGGHEVFRTP